MKKNEKYAKYEKKRKILAVRGKRAVTSLALTRKLYTVG